METDHRLFRSRWAGIVHVFVFLFVGIALTGYVLALRQPLDLFALFALKTHVWLGYFATIPFAVITAVHLRKLYGTGVMLLGMASLGAMVFAFFIDLGPIERLVLALAPLVYVTTRHFFAGDQWPRPRLILGTLSFAGLVMLLGTGWLLAGPAHTLRTSAISTLHDTLGWILPPLALIHVFRKYEREEDPHWRARWGLLLCWCAALGAWTAMEVASAKTRERLRLAPVVSPSTGSDPEGCGHAACHTEISKQWGASPHRFSSSSLPYLKVAALFEQEKGEGARDFCRGCHEPSALLGAQDAPYAPPPPGIQPSVSCRVCHLIDRVASPGENGHFDLAPERLFLPGHEAGNNAVRDLLDDFTLLDKRDHRAAYRREAQQSDDFCRACHNSLVLSPGPGKPDVVIEGPFPSWEKSFFAREGIGCVHCHMQLFRFPDPDSMDKPHHSRPDHRMFGINAYLATTLPEGQFDETALDAFRVETLGWLAGTLDISTYEQLYLRRTRDPRWDAFRTYFQGKPLLNLKLRGEGDGSSLVLTAETTNSRIGHRFPTGLLDLSEVWLEVRIAGADGRTVYESGIPRQDGTLPPDTRSLAADVLDRDGRPVTRHRVWTAAKIETRRLLEPGETVYDRFGLPSLPEGTFPLTARVRWLYRRYNPEFSAWVFGPGHIVPVVELASAELQFGGNAAGPSAER
ncbi:MAG: hypothetical protein HYY13_09755 [Nitrospirae bacterium]|nr:hypothetical protein [Nitrospirota bacterium]